MILKSHIVDYIGHHATNDNLYVFMGLKEGNLADLVRNGVFKGNLNLLNVVYSTYSKH